MTGRGALLLYFVSAFHPTFSHETSPSTVWEAGYRRLELTTVVGNEADHEFFGVGSTEHHFSELTQKFMNFATNTPKRRPSIIKNPFSTAVPPVLHSVMQKWSCTRVQIAS
ncbi:hypothetical protein ONS95_002739 [Cadophora gregata]|uniref:uncharacterized protein n=1 Tax=Cadophora gregata TaxID=51156 RepID=UPI0026DCBBC5|nr:uncharacterized protein ONS95_002739 [Cadophora gregata]KAK0110083.1 hypothetical protein ONS95_002739 [Cadophora gregata]KAK0110298.1 hypothetical protein ONS96_001916 [Cadophora gregata f. sp. sojae]